LPRLLPLATFLPLTRVSPIIIYVAAVVLFSSFCYSLTLGPCALFLFCRLFDGVQGAPDKTKKGEKRVKRGGDDGPAALEGGEAAAEDESPGRKRKADVKEGAAVAPAKSAKGQAAPSPAKKSKVVTDKDASGAKAAVKGKASKKGKKKSNV
jgi:hypothetical protein